MLKNLWMDQAGAVVSIEMVMICTIAVLALIVGWTEIAVSVTTELNDISNSLGAFNQSFAFTGFSSPSGWKLKAFFSGSSFEDHVDDCDTNQTCDIVCGAGPNTGERW